MNNIFYDNPYLKENETNLLFNHTIDGKYYVILKDNLFYPQGGGQKGDKGTLFYNNETYEVLNTIKHPEIEGSLVQIDREIITTSVSDIKCELNWHFRYSQMRLHSLLHLYHCLIEKVIEKDLIYPKVSSIKDNNTAFLQYVSDDINEDVINKVNELLNQEIIDGNEVLTYPDQEKVGYRWWKYKSYLIPCGGTHIKNINEIGETEISFSTKKGLKTISFTLKEVKE